MAIHTPDEDNVSRSHDTFYSTVDSKAPPKDSFVFAANFIAEFKKSLGRTISMADIGCAAGAFPNYLASRFPDDEVIGYEYLDSLVESARKHYPGVRVEQASLLDRDSISTRHDVITLLGVLSIFDDIEVAISNLVHWIRPGGKIFIFGVINPYDVDVYIKYRHAEHYGQPRFESGWNIVSQKTIELVLKKHGARDVRFHEFEISVDLARNESDPLRSWTEKMADGRRQIVNGLWLKQPQYLVEASL